MAALPPIAVPPKIKVQLRAVGGAPMLTTLGMGPVTQGMGLIFPVLSYCGRITISFTSCREILPDPEFFEACITESFAALLDASATANPTAATE